MAWDFFCWEVRDGSKILFWSDPWCAVGRLIDVIGDQGTCSLGIQRWQKLNEIVSEDGWWFQNIRSPFIRTVIEAIHEVQPPSVDAGSDRLLWRHDLGVYKMDFSSYKIWNQLRRSRDQLPWTEIIWFSQGIPRCAFISWLTVLDRLSTGVRMRSWGMNQACVLCGERDETRDHLFFACPYSFVVWTEICGDLLGIPPDPDWTITMDSIMQNKGDRIAFILIRIAFQVTIYNIWKERNGRIHGQAPRPTGVLTRLIDRYIRARIVSLDYATNPRLHNLLQQWFRTRLSSMG